MKRYHIGVVVALLLTLGSPLAGLAAQSEETGPQPRHEAAAQIIGELLSHYHYSNQPIDDGLSREALSAYLGNLDPQRLFFLQSDVERLEPLRTRLDDQLRAGDLQAAWDIFELYRTRVAERAEYARGLLDGELDFSDKETLDVDRSDAPWPQDPQALNDLWRRRVENDVLTLRLAGTDPQEIMKTLDQRYAQLSRNLEQYGPNDVFEIYMNSWTNLYDPHTSYLSPRTRENFDINMSLSLQGIGALLRSDGNYTEIAELIQGGPAAKSGELNVGDRIVGVAQEDAPFVSVVGWRLPDVVDLIRGPKGSVVRLQILPATAAEGERHDVAITRNEIELTERAASSSIETVGGRRIGVIELSSFYHEFSDDSGDRPPRSTTRDVRELLAKLTDKGIDGLVIDLRGNAGGSLLEVVRLTGLFIDAGPVVQVRYSDGETSILRDEDNGRVAYDGPLTVLVDGYSASASEIFAAAIQDYGRGVIVGGQTFGKGTVQDLVDLNRYRVAGEGHAGSLKFTRAKYYRITGGSTQLRGVEPDISLDGLLGTARSVTERSEPHALPWDEIASLPFSERRDLDAVIPELIRRHETRRAESEALAALGRQVDLRRAEAQQQTVSLNEEIRRAERERREQAQLEAVNRRLNALDREPVDKLTQLDEEELPDLVLRETARITRDLAQLLGGNAGTRIAVSSGE
jgi:carboxyl-terminal processing protease